MKKIPDPGKFSVSPLYKRASVKLMHMNFSPATKQLLDNDVFLKNVINKNEAITTLATGQTSITCTLEGLSDNSSISVYADVPGVGYTDIVVDGDNVTITFEEQKQDIQVKVVVADGMV